MRVFGTTFAAELLKPTATPFYTARFRFATGDVFVAGRGAVIGGNAHTVVLAQVGPVGSNVGRREPTQLDVMNSDLQFVNMPYPAGAPGQLTTGQRLPDRFPRTLYTVETDVYLNFELSDGSFVQELIFPGAIQAAPGSGYVSGSVRVSALIEKYLNASVHRKFLNASRPFIRQSDSGATIPIVIGTVPKSPGRVVKRGKVSTPVAAVGNLGSGILNAPIANSAAVAETWTITFTTPETVEFTGATNTDQPLNAGTFSATPMPVRAQSFTLAQPELLQSITLRLKNAGTGYNAWRLEVWTDVAGNPGIRVTTSAIIPGFVPPAAIYTNFTFVFPRIPLNASTTYWIVAIAEVGGDPNVPSGNVLKWAAASAGGYAGGKAKAGTYTAVSFGSNSLFWNYTFEGNITWDASLDAADLWFQLGFASNAYAAVGSVTGADGAGSVNTDFTSTSGAITIPATAWQGTPQAGDVFTFMVDPSPSIAIFSESPAATPVKALQALYWDDTRVGAGTTVTNSPGWGTVQSFGDTVRRALAESIPITGTQSFKRIGFQLRRQNNPTSPVRFQVRRDQGGVPGPVILATVDVAPDLIPLGSTTPPITYAAIPLVSGTNETLWIVADTDQNNATDCYIMAASAGSVIPGVAMQESTAGAWISLAGDLGCEITGAAIVALVSTDDGTGNLVAEATYDVDIPDAVAVTADVDGISDDTLGTYTSAPSTVLSVPGHVIHWLLIRAGFPAASIDLAGSFATSNAQYGTLYRFNGTAQKNITYKQLLLQLAYECRSYFDCTWLAQLKFIPDVYPAPLRTFTLNDILTDAGHVPLLRLAPSAADELINTLTANYNRVAAGTTYKSTLSRYAPDSVAASGRLERTDLQNMDFVRDANMAKGVLDCRLRRQAFPVTRATFTTLLPFLAIEKDDPVALDLRNPNEGNEAMGGWNGSQTLQVEAANQQPTIFGVDFVLRETGLVVNLLDGDPNESGVAAVVVLRDQTDGSLWDLNFTPVPYTFKTPPTSGGAPFDGIALSGTSAGWFVYIDNGQVKWSNTVSLTATLPWLGFPPLAIQLIAGDYELVVG